MHEYYYIDASGAQSGPVSMHILLAMRLPETTLVWREGMPAWAEYRTIAELHMQEQSAQPTQGATSAYTQPVPTPTQPASAYAQSASAVRPEQTYGSQFVEEPYSNKPDSYLVWAILSTVLCCIPLGIVSILKATKVDSLWNARQYDAARRASADAKKWAIWGAVSGLLFSIIYVVMLLVGASMGVYK